MNDKKSDYTKKVTLGNVHDALEGIEQWCSAVRRAIAYLPPDTVIPVPPGDLKPSNGLPVIMGCPPPPPPPPPDDDC